MEEKENILEQLKISLNKAFFPLRYTCSVCGREVFDDSFLCKKCFDTLELNDGFRCEKCGRKTAGETSNCVSCRTQHGVDKARSAFSYEGAIIPLIHKLKYSSAKYVATLLAPYLKEVYVNEFFSPDVITFVPMRPLPKEERGYNQAEILAEELAKLVDNQVIEALSKTRDTSNQASLGYKDRLENLKNAYKVIDVKAIKDKKVLLVDDVLTTGATSDEVALTLKRAGAKSVYLLTVASVPDRIDLPEND